MQSLSEFKFVSLHKWTAGPKYLWSFKTPRTAKIIMEKKSNIGGFALNNLKFYHKSSHADNVVLHRIDTEINGTELRVQK